ncbi:hypothetical protein IU500_06945 [Nocardia terpenica]|uniref:hypothetical protein n=1 Tax=Nocardia terpenica TaxID=455432 RepID=UPI0018954C98|nr:hypothetical protein [Nocardia terpenica]MBF6060513.1 hypothetical protein [Nocardia terpenica]MBF6103773.1 hypothetical protein [Nocardia terpenica]MBF6111853.1 hypothetical protein [Nocardia terpenica]MBF6117994.1 hypothetical protein [Nocardia terpenica]MBF6155280.1 hypothetical protein [Nocardia terpenica]
MSSLVAGTPTLDPYEYASQLVRGYCGIAFDYTRDDTKLLDPRGDGTVQLPQTPVLAVSAVAGWMPGPAGRWDWQPITWFRWLPRGLLYCTARLEVTTLPTWGPVWPWVPGGLRVTYDHGYPTIPDDIQAVVTRLATQISKNPAWVQSRKVGEVATVYTTTGITLRDEDKRVLDRYAAQEVS